MDLDSIKVNLCDFKGTCVSEVPLPHTVNDDDKLEVVTYSSNLLYLYSAEDISELNHEEYQAYTTFEYSSYFYSNL